MGRHVVRARGDLRYAYYLTTKDGRQKETCCGRQGRPETRRKALNAEILDLEERARALRGRAKALRSEMKSIGMNYQLRQAATLLLHADGAASSGLRPRRGTGRAAEQAAPRNRPRRGTGRAAEQAAPRNRPRRGTGRAAEQAAPRNRPRRGTGRAAEQAAPRNRPRRGTGRAAEPLAKSTRTP